MVYFSASHKRWIPTIITDVGETWLHWFIDVATFRPSTEIASITHLPTFKTLLTQDKDEVELEIKPGVAGLTWIGAKGNKEYNVTGIKLIYYQYLSMMNSA